MSLSVICNYVTNLSGACVTLFAFLHVCGGCTCQTFVIWSLFTCLLFLLSCSPPPCCRLVPRAGFRSEKSTCLSISDETAPWFLDSPLYLTSMMLVFAAGLLILTSGLGLSCSKSASSSSKNELHSLGWLSLEEAVPVLLWRLLFPLSASLLLRKTPFSRSSSPPCSSQLITEELDVRPEYAGGLLT